MCPTNCDHIDAKRTLHTQICPRSAASRKLGARPLHLGARSPCGQAGGAARPSSRKARCGQLRVQVRGCCDVRGSGAPHPPPPGPPALHEGFGYWLWPNSACPRPVSPFLWEPGHSQASGWPWTPDTLRGRVPKGPSAWPPD